MEALCPFCLNEDDARPDCEECGRTGTIHLVFAEGAMYTMKCKDPTCGFENGCRIVGPGLPPIEDDLGQPKVCIECGFEADYELVTWVCDPDKDESGE